MGKRQQQKCNVEVSRKRRNSSNLKHYGAVSWLRMNQKSPGSVVGTCMTMCPAAEIVLREREILIHPFEVQQGTARHKIPMANPAKMVKAYSRPAAGRVDPVPSDLRPAAVLLNTVKYLLEEIVTLGDCNWTDVYDYVSDRLRAVRQDLIIQALHGPPVINILENTVLFHIYSGYRLCMEPVSVFVPTLNNNQIQESLKWLLSQYQESEGCHDNRPLFESIYLLYNLGNTEALRHYLQLEKSLRQCQLLRTSYRISVGYLTGGYVRTMRLIRRLPSVMCQMAAHQHFVAIQRQTLQVIAAGYNSKNLRYPVSKLTELLPLDSEQAVTALCRHCGFSVMDGKVQFVRTSYKPDVEIKPTHVNFIEERLRSVSIRELFFTYFSHKDIFKQTVQPSQGNVRVMSLPFKFKRMNIAHD